MSWIYYNSIYIISIVGLIYMCMNITLYVDAVIIVLNEHNISQIGGATKVKPKKYTLLLIPYKIAGTRKRNELRNVPQEMP